MYSMFGETKVWGRCESYCGVRFRNTDSAEENIGPEHLLVSRDEVPCHEGRIIVRHVESLGNGWRHTKSFADKVELVHVGLPGPEWTPTEQLGEDASQRPHVHRGAVLSVPNQQLGSPVPACRHIVRVVVLWSR